jgi:DNA-binding transcriptional regulator YhcF (GntR family)
MAYDPADKRPLFQRVVDELVQQIRDGKLLPGDRIPSAKEISDGYEVSSMTAQRALRELQAMGLTHGMAGKGTFVHPEAPIKVLPADEPSLRSLTPAQYGLFQDALGAALDEGEEVYRQAFIEALTSGKADPEAAERAAARVLASARQQAMKRLTEHLATAQDTQPKPAKRTRKPKAAN